MNGISSYINHLEPEQFWSVSRKVLAGALGLVLALILLAAWSSVTAQAVVGALIVGGLVFSYFARHELTVLSVILIGFISIVGYEEGIQPEEVIYGLVYLSYLSYWFVSRLFFYRDKILRTWVDWAVFLFLIYATLSLGLTPLLGGELTAAISEWMSISMLAFYFPIKEICIRHEYRLPHKAILASFAAVALFIAARNALRYATALSEAEHLYQIATGRVVMNEKVLLMAGLFTLVYLLYARRRSAWLLLVALLTIFSAGIVIGQSRAVWVAYALGITVIFFFVDNRRRLQIAVLGTVASAAVFAVMLVLFNDFFQLILAGLADRLFSLRTAATEDVSLVNRFVEMEAVWQYVSRNPIIGYGFGVPYRYYSLVYEATNVTSFVHNGYLGVIFRHGLVGFVLIYSFYFGSMWRFFNGIKRPRLNRSDRLILIAALACLTAQALVINTANPFSNSDTTLIIATAAALGNASMHRVERDSPSLL